MDQRKHVLVVDDDKALRDLLRDILHLEGYKVTTAQDGCAALEVLQTIQPDLILLDLMMPCMNGYVFVEELRHREPRLTSPIVILSADVRAKPKVAQMNVANYIQKPFDLDDFLDVVEQYLNGDLQHITNYEYA